MQNLSFGRFEGIRIRDGEPILMPWPKMIRDIKFGTPPSTARGTRDYLLKDQVADFFEWLRTTKNADIRVLEVRHGLPFSMEVEVFEPEAALV
jgi:hypothetical protein